MIDFESDQIREHEVQLFQPCAFAAGKRRSCEPQRHNRRAPIPLFVQVQLSEWCAETEWRAWRFPDELTRAGRFTIRWRTTRGRWCGWRIKTRSRHTCGRHAFQISNSLTYAYSISILQAAIPKHCGPRHWRCGNFCKSASLLRRQFVNSSIHQGII